MPDIPGATTKKMSNDLGQWSFGPVSYLSKFSDIRDKSLTVSRWVRRDSVVLFTAFSSGLLFTYATSSATVAETWARSCPLARSQIV